MGTGPSPAQAMRITILIPTLNEEGGIGPTLDAIDRTAFDTRGWELEMLVVDGQSTDLTRQEAKRRGAKVVIEPRRGYGRAYKTGFDHATGDIIVTGDADATYPFDKAHELVAYLVDHHLDFLTCDRYADLRTGAMSAKHKFGNWVLTKTARVLFGVRVHDSQSGMWVFRRNIIRELPLATMPDGMAFSQEIKIEAFRRFGPAAREVPGSLRPRIGTPVISSWRDGLGNLAALGRLRWTRRD